MNAGRTMTEEAADAVVCQAVADAHTAIAGSTNREISTYGQGIYDTSRVLLVRTIGAAYGVGHNVSHKVYDVFIATGESISWCYEYVCDHRISTYYIS